MDAERQNPGGTRRPAPGGAGGSSVRSRPRALVQIALLQALVAFAACSSQPPAEFRVDRGQLPICGVHTSQPVIGLSFDGGPGPYTDADLQLVRSVGARATFFVTAKH